MTAATTERQSTVTLASAGAQLIENGYRIIPIEPGTKRPNLPGWPSIKATAETLAQWKAEGRGNWGIGILGEETPGVDLDISDKQVLDNVLNWCRKNIGVENTRVGRAPRTLFACWADKPFGKMSSRKFQSPDGATHQIEILGKGNQYVAYATHPDTGKPYAWDGAEPLGMPAELLPTLTPEKARALIEYFESQVPDGWVPITNASTKTASEHEGNPLKIAALHRLRSAVEAIPNNDLAYEDWIKVMLALWAAVGENKADGFEIFDAWSSTSAKYDLDETARVWNAAHADHIGAGTLFYLARQNGWVEPPEDMSAYLEAVDIDAPANDNAGPQKPDRFKFETLEDLAALPKTKWLIDGWIPENSTGILYGKWASGKSFLAFDLGLHVAYGFQNWHGAGLPGEPRKVLVLAREGHQGFVDRAEAFRRLHNIKEKTSNFIFLRTPINFMAADDFKALEQRIKDCGEQFALVIVDTVARVIPGADMSTPETVTAFMERCDRLGRAAGGTVIGVHHQNKSGTMMGSVYFEANADFVFDLTREGGENTPLRKGTIRCTKMKEGVDGWSRAVTFTKMEWEDEGELHSSLAVETIVLPNRQALPHVSEAARVLLSCLQEAMTEAGGQPVAWQAWQRARYRRSNHNWTPGDPLPENCKGSTLQKRRKELVDAGCVFKHGDDHFSVDEIEAEAA